MARIKSDRSTEKLLKKIGTLTTRLNEAREELNALRYDEFIALADSAKGGNELLQTALDRFHRILSSLKNGMLLMTRDNRVEFVNQPFCDIFGLKESPKDLLNLSTEAIIEKVINKHLDPAAAEKRIREIVLEMKPVFGEDITMKSGRTYLRDFVPLEVGKNNFGRLWHYVDITDHKNTENALTESEGRFRALAENIPDMIVRFDNDLRLLYGNPAVLKRTGLPLESLIGKTSIEYGAHPDTARKWENAARHVFKTAETIRMEHTNYWQGEERVFDVILVPEKNSCGAVCSIISIARDITEMKEVENTLRKSEKDLLESRENYKELVTNARSIILKMDTDGKFIFINEFGQNFFGFSNEELIGKHALGTIVPINTQSEKGLDKLVESIIRDPDSFSVNININVKKNGELVWIEWYNKALFDENGKRTGHMAIGVDVTKRKIAEEALQENERKLRSVLNATLESVYMFDRNGIVCMSNSTGIERVNRKNENEVVGHHFSKFMSPEIARLRQEKFDEVFNTGNPLEFEDERAGKTYHHNFFPVFRDNEVIYVVSYSTDITARKKAETKLMESEDRFRTIAESLTVMISITRISDSTISFVNEPFENAFGFSKDDLLGKKLPGTIFSKADSQNIGKILNEFGDINNREIKVNKSDGTSFWIMLTIKKINFQNEPSYLSASIDITSSKRAQLELIRLNRVLDAHSKSSQAMIHADNEYNYISKVCKIIIEDCGHTMVWIGYAQNDAKKSVLPVAYYGFDKGYIDQLNITWDDNIQGRGPTGTAIRTGERYICRNMLTDPSFEPWREAAIERGYASSVVLPLRSEGKTFGAISIYSKEPDPFSETEINFLSELADDMAYGISFLRLAESERAAARAIKENEIKLKELITTKDKFFNIVAHDLKNPFTSLLGSSELLYENIEEMTAENVRQLALILNASAKGGYAILQNLLDWSRSQTGLIKFTPKNLNLRDIIEENIDSLQLQIINKGVNMKSLLNHDLYINVDKNMVNTVLRNLLSNAVKYTYKGGHITISVTSDNKEVMVTVKDTGTGIPEDHIENLFKLDNSLSNPGTEKEQGTGLGLKLCKEFTEMMGGKIWVESKLNEGSEFKFTLPVIA